MGELLRLFNHGKEAVAIVIPKDIQDKLQMREGEEYEFVELSEGMLLLVSKEALKDSMKTNVLLELVRRLEKPEAKNSIQESERFGRNAPVQIESIPEDRKQLEQLLRKNEVIVLLTEEDARTFSKVFEKELREGSLLGIRGFDKKFYIINSASFSALSEKIMSSLSEAAECSLQELCFRANATEELCVASLLLLKEKGEIIERKKGIYSLVK